MRTKQYEIGERAEARLKQELTIPGARFMVPLSQHYDLLWGLGDYEFAIECKTAASRYSNGRIGYAKLPIEQVAHMTMLWKSSAPMQPILIVQLRTPNYRNRAWIVVPWNLVEAQFSKNKPAMISLTFWWLVRNGINLHCWLELLKRGLLTRDGGALR